MKTTIKSVRRGYERANLEAASIIASQPDRYPGLMQEWADTVLTNAAEAKTIMGPLFGSRAA